MNTSDSNPILDSSSLPVNKKAKAIQKKRAAENTYEALQLKKSAAIYLRVSSEMQVDGFSIEAQKNACLKYAAEQGYEVTDAHIYIDEAFSAKNEDRPEFKRLMIAAHSSEFSLIIIHKMDRFERNFRAMTNTLENLSNIGVHVYSIHENLELANTLTVNLFGIINEHYIQNLSWETAKGKHQAAKEGYFIGSRVPFGYRKWKIGDPPEMDKRLLFIEEKEAMALRHCFEMYASGNCTFGDLADYLNDQGFISRSGRQFRDDTLRCMLENPIYIGIIEYQGAKKETYLTYQGKQPPLISTELFNQVAKVRAEKEKRKTHAHGKNGHVKDHYMLQGLISCASCGRKLRVFSTKYNNRICEYYYKDYSEERGLECKDSGKAISASYVDGLMLSFLSSIILPRNWINQIIDQKPGTDSYQEINEQINKIKNRMERRSEAYSISDVYLNFEKYEREQRADQKLIDDLTKRLPKDSAVINTHITLTTSLIDLFIQATKRERYDIVHFLFSNVYVDLTNCQLTAFEPNPEFEFLFSTFSDVNGWTKEDNRYYFTIHESVSYKDFQINRIKDIQKKKRKTISSSNHEAAKKGFFIGPRAPLGYKKTHYPDPAIPDLHILLIDPPAAEVVRKCFEIYASGNCSYSYLADFLNKRGFHNSLNKPFNEQNIMALLTNRTYIGQIVYKGKEIYSGKHEAIIPRELWELVQAVRSSRVC